MPDAKKIGAFDSGVGGLSILSEMRRMLPQEDFLYLADTAHCPYGTKSISEIRKRVLDVTRFLVEQDVKMVVVACNSASVAGLDQVREAFPQLPIIGVEPAVKPAHDLTRNGKIGVLATDMTIHGDRFTTLVERFGAGVEVYTQPAPGLVELVENGKAESEEAESLLHQYLDPLFDKGIDTLVLGCTHYPFLKPLIQKIGGSDLVILDIGEAVARQTVRVLEQSGLRHPGQLKGSETFYTSGNPEAVTDIVRKLWGAPQAVVLKGID